MKIEAGLDVDAMGTADRDERPVSDADSARSAENIEVWRSYLPQDCVETMIKMGWDRGT